MKGEWGAEGKLPSVTQLLKEVLLRAQQPLLLACPRHQPRLPPKFILLVLGSCAVLFAYLFCRD